MAGYDVNLSTCCHGYDKWAMLYKHWNLTIVKWFASASLLRRISTIWSWPSQDARYNAVIPFCMYTFVDMNYYHHKFQHAMWIIQYCHNYYLTQHHITIFTLSCELTCALLSIRMFTMWAYPFSDATIRGVQPSWERYSYSYSYS